MKYTITRCPNSEDVRAALSKIMPPGHRQRRRGRGHRFPRFPGDCRYHQTLPLNMAGWFSQYVEPKDDPDPYRWTPRDYLCKFTRLESDGRVRLRLQISDNYFGDLS